MMDENQIESEDKDEVTPKPWRSSVYPTPRSSRPASSFSWATAALPLVFVLGIGFGWFIWGRSSAQQQPASGAGTEIELTRYDVSVDDDPSIGPEDAPITVIEFSDYQCPYCIRWHDTVYSRLMAEYEGRIRFVYRDFPLSAIHPDAQAAAEAANCAGEQGDYWQYHDALFSGKYGLGMQAYSQYATELQLDVTAFETCMAERRYKDEVQADANFASAQGLNGTPVFFINGLRIIGAQPYEVFVQIIDQELAGEIPK